MVAATIARIKAIGSTSGRGNKNSESREKEKAKS
jgi:hypothetical protein